MLMNLTGRKYFDEINIVKGIAMLTVIWHHSMIVYPVDLQSLPWCQHALAVNQTYFLVVFFLVSGYLYAHSSRKSLSASVKSKVMRLLVPYFSFALVNLSVKLLAPGLVNKKVESVSDYLVSLFVYGGELWFLYVLFLIFMIWPLLVQQMQRYQIGGTILGLAVMEILMARDSMEGPFLYHEFIYYSVFFLTGYLLKDVRRDVLQRWQSCMVAAVLFLLLCVVFVMDIHIPYVDAYVKGAIGCLFVWTLSFQLLKIAFLARPLAFVGKYSLSYYWLNGFALVISRCVVINVLHIVSSPLIALTILCMNVCLITLAVLVIRRIPVVRIMIGVK